MTPEPCCNPLCGADAASGDDLCESCRTNWDALEYPEESSGDDMVVFDLTEEAQ